MGGGETARRSQGVAAESTHADRGRLCVGGQDVQVKHLKLPCCRAGMSHAAALWKVGRLCTPSAFPVFLFFFLRENTLQVFLKNSLSTKVLKPVFYCQNTNNNGDFFSTDLSMTGRFKGTSKSKVEISSSYV